MASENKMGEGMTKKQKATAIGLVVVLIIIIWQVMGLFGGSKPESTSAIVPAAHKGTMSANNPATTQQIAARNNANPVINNPSVRVQQTQLREMPVNMDARLVDLQKQTEQKQIDQLNQLQTLKLQREIAETNQAIASARLATVTAEKSVSDLLTRPAPQQVPASAYTSTLVNPTQTGVQVASEPQQAPAPVEVQYVVISVSMEMGRWHAVLGYQGKLYNVSIGDILPADNSVVVSIGKNGVILLKDNKRKKISIISSI